MGTDLALGTIVPTKGPPSTQTTSETPQLFLLQPHHWDRYPNLSEFFGAFGGSEGHGGGFLCASTQSDTLNFHCRDGQTGHVKNPGIMILVTTTYPFPHH